MGIFIIYAHPATQGHCSAVLRAASGVLERQKAKFEILDLYESGFDPLLSRAEHYTAGNREVAQKTREIQEKIAASSSLIFIYPVWWGTMPAILKGFFDRVLAPGFAYKYEGVIPKKLLAGKKALVFTTCGAPLAYLALIFNRPKTAIKKDILGFCGVRARVVQFGWCRKPTPERIRAIEESTKKVILKSLRKGML